MKYVEWLEDDIGVIVRGISGLIAFVISGIMLAEGALNDLTQHAYFVQFINLQATKSGLYTLYLFGHSFQFSSVLEIGTIRSQGQSLLLEIWGHGITINTLPVIDIHDTFTVLSSWIGKIKQSLWLLLGDAGHWLYSITGQFIEYIRYSVETFVNKSSL
jgi:hypothetical protein